MTAIPPNNLEQLVAWIRLFAENTSNKIKDLEQNLKDAVHKIRRMENDPPK